MANSKTQIFTYVIKLPSKVNEMVLPCFDGFTIYISDQLDDEHRKKAWAHAMKHIAEGDFDDEHVQQLERRAHKQEGGTK